MSSFPRQDGANPSRTGRWQDVLLAAVVAILLLLAARHLPSGYSYWGDEMYSIAYSLSPREVFWGTWVPGDVHPPLYQLLLSSWMKLFGTGEVATRLLSFLFVALALGLMAILTAGRSLLFRLVAVCFLGSSPAFAYYGQETRSYGMMLGLSTLVTLLAMDLRAKSGGAPSKERWIFGVFALLLSITHYFGFIWVGVLCLFQISRPTTAAERKQGLILLALILIWPLIHIALGGLISETGGSFWIDLPVPILSTVNRAMTGLLPGLEISIQPQRAIRWVVVGLVLLLLSWPLSQWRQSLRASGDSVRLGVHQSNELAGLIVVFIVLVALVDLHSPMSTARNFIVLLPAMALMLAGWSDALAARLRGPRRLLLFTGLALLLLLQLNAAAAFVASKAYPPADWKTLGKVLRQLDLCRDGCPSDMANTYFNYYFTGLVPLPTKPSASDPRPIVLKEANPRIAASHRCYAPRQSGGVPVLMVPPAFTDTAALSKAGLSPCPPTKGG